MNVLVTGASSGIGRATAIELAGRGHHVYAAARNATALAALADEHPGITAMQMDVTDPDSVREGVAKIEADGGVDILVNSAGFALIGPLEALSGAGIERQFATNVFGLLAVTRAVLPGMRARRSGRIINISSLLGRFSMAGTGAYGATKYAVEALSDALRQEVAEFGIRVIIVEPGFVATNIGGAADAHADPPLPVPDDYAALVTAGDAYLTAQVAKGVAANTIATAIADAATRRNPRIRYVVPATMKPLIMLLTSLPGRLADRAKRRALGLA